MVSPPPSPPPAAGELCVLGVTIQAGAEKANPCLDVALASAPLQAGVEVRRWRRAGGRAVRRQFLGAPRARAVKGAQRARPSRSWLHARISLPVPSLAPAARAYSWLSRSRTLPHPCPTAALPLLPGPPEGAHPHPRAVAQAARA